MKSSINEIFILRSIACLAVILTHTIGLILNEYPHVANIDSKDAFSIEFINSIHMLTKFGTPIFIFISILLLAYRYKDSLPKEFLKKRARFILFPYVAMGIFYAIMYGIKQMQNVQVFFDLTLTRTWQNILLGNYHGYFILIIFQFYLLFKFCKKYLDKYSPKKIIIISMLINLLYLSFFNFVRPIESIPHADYIWSKLYWLPFLGWVFYFTLAYYCGYYYESFKRISNDYFKWFIASAIVFGVFILLTYNSGLIPIENSKRVDMVFFATSMFFVIFQGASRLKRVPKILEIISKYSFGVYLIHWVVVIGILKILEKLPLNLGLMSFLVTYVLGIIFSIIVVHVINKAPFGMYVVGKIGPGIKNETKNEMKLRA